MKIIHSVALFLVGLVLLVTAAPASAITVTGVVNNYFERSCTFSCGKFVQLNGSYNKNVPSTCVTKKWWIMSSYYTKPAGSRC